MSICPKCGGEWEPTGSPFLLCRGCRAGMPPRKVNGPLDRGFKLLQQHRRYGDALVNSQPMHPDMKRAWKHYFGDASPRFNP